MWIAPDRGVLVWTPIVLLLLPALVRSWGSLPDWSRSLLVGGLLYTVTQAGMMTFTGGFGFYGYRYGLEFLACATPALALSQMRMGRVARILAGPVLALQFFAFFLGATFDFMWLPEDEAWHSNAFVFGLDAMGVAGWMLASLVAAAGGYVAWRLSRHRPLEAPSTPDTAPDTSRRDLTGPRPGL
jgi:alpha-1,2-mannosyltransferase